jgi:hypothetical protein
VNWRKLFWDKVDTKGGKPSEPDIMTCWEWKAGRATRGYGQALYKGKQWRAHRLAWALYYGPIPKGMIIRHRCNNPPCCNPLHLQLGTNADNAMDAMEFRRRMKVDFTPIKEEK